MEKKDWITWASIAVVILRIILKREVYLRKSRSLRKSDGRFYALRYRSRQKTLPRLLVIRRATLTDFSTGSGTVSTTCFHNSDSRDPENTEVFTHIPWIDNIGLVYIASPFFCGLGRQKQGSGIISRKSILVWKLRRVPDTWKTANKNLCTCVTIHAPVSLSSARGAKLMHTCH